MALVLGACDNPDDIIREVIDHIGNHGERPGPPACGAAGETNRPGRPCPPVEVGEGERCGGFTSPARICQPDLHCMPAAGACNVPDVPGVCEVTPTGCSREFVPVCGCDGKTYNNDCLRRAERVALAHPGACRQPPGEEGDACGGFAGLRCGEGLTCDAPPDTCQVFDLPGVCKVIPTGCSREFAPVCGCDGTTYNNDCLRLSARAAKAHDGACTPG